MNVFQLIRNTVKCFDEGDYACAVMNALQAIQIIIGGFHPKHEGASFSNPEQAAAVQECKAAKLSESGVIDKIRDLVREGKTEEEIKSILPSVAPWLIVFILRRLLG